MNKQRLLIRVPVLAIHALNQSEQSANQKLAEIIKTFPWDSLPSQHGFNCSMLNCQQVTITISTEDSCKFVKHCCDYRKSMPSCLVQALMVLGHYSLPVGV